METPKFNLEDIKFSEDHAMFERALDLFRNNKVTNFTPLPYGYQATVQGTKSNSVMLAAKAVDLADYDCYMGQNDMLCKHALAVALEALRQAGIIDAEGEKIGAKAGHMTADEAKLHITAGLRKIRAYNGLSKIWFSYQRSLSVGSGIITEAVSQLKPSVEHAQLIWNTVLKLSKKLSTGGVDDSDGTVGDCCFHLVSMLNEWLKSDNLIRQAVSEFSKNNTGFGFEDDLLKSDS